MPYTVDFLKSPEAKAGRLSRLGRDRYVVWAHKPDGIVELDATSPKHGAALAETWLRNIPGVSRASVRYVLGSGDTVSVLTLEA